MVKKKSCVALNSKRPIFRKQKSQKKKKNMGALKKNILTDRPNPIFRNST